MEREWVTLVTKNYMIEKELSEMSVEVNEIQKKKPKTSK